jgi:hypothetical protein
MSAPLSLKAARDTAGTLGFPSKMPGTSYGIPAQACLTGGKLATVPGSVCHDCYALKGNYVYPSVRTAQAQRLAGLDHPNWVAAITAMLNRVQETGLGRNGPIDRGFHRWHDSGDLQSLEHLDKICAVARATPHIRHWLPTRETAMVAAYVAAGHVIPENLTVRVSDTMVDGRPTRAWPLTSGVTTHQWFSPLGDDVPIANLCPAPSQDGKCGACRKCWDPAIARVTYHFH